MPLYEYICDDGEVIELLRPMSDADLPVEDPAGKGRTFRRLHSTFMVGQGAAPASGSRVSLPAAGGCCPCGKTHGSCGS
jgi:putative FmdB family regulatory protein